MKTKENEAKLRNLALEALREDFENVNFTVESSHYINFVAGYGIELRAEKFFSEHLNTYGVTLEQYNNGWREIATLHLNQH